MKRLFGFANRILANHRPSWFSDQMKTSHSKFGPLKLRDTVRLAFYLGCADQSLESRRTRQRWESIWVTASRSSTSCCTCTGDRRRGGSWRSCGVSPAVSRCAATFFSKPCAKEVSIAIPSGQAHRVSSPEPIRAIFDATRFVQTIPTPDRRHRSR